MLELALIAIFGIAAYRRGARLTNHNQAGAQPGSGSQPTASSQPEAKTHRTQSRSTAYADAASRTGPQGLPGWSTAAGRLAAQVQTAGENGHAADVNALRGQIANAAAKNEISPQAEKWLTDKLASLTGAALGAVPLVGPLLKTAWQLDYAHPQATAAAPPETTNPTADQLVRTVTKHQSDWATGNTDALPTVGVKDTAYVAPVRNSNNPVAGDIAAIDVTKL